ncbi:hypothetical protein T492DRAFT_1043087 [Pavlovales sp. CCMP2436]|nr:hypothetical protein T492DRAFT_1043087 [Pavlovales sp. CCMP2436]
MISCSGSPCPSCATFARHTHSPAKLRRAESQLFRSRLKTRRRNASMRRSFLCAWRSGTRPALTANPQSPRRLTL